LIATRVFEELLGFEKLMAVKASPPATRQAAASSLSGVP
jgi:hypothetical protein